jgi:phosphotransferase system  glucose/maltose/N-acetylglucosamine-specific IIC component
MFDNAVAPVVSLIEDLLSPLLLIVGAVGAIYCVILGAKFAKAEEPQDREKAKGALKNAIIGFLLIFILLVLLKGLMPQMIKWVNSNYKGTI